MSVISVFSGVYCEADQVVNRLVSATGFRLLTDEELARQAGEAAGLSKEKVMRAFSSKTSIFNKFTHEKEHAVSQLKLQVARALRQENLVIYGFAAHLIPMEIAHVLRVCLIADVKFRVRTAARIDGFLEKDALKNIHARDEERAAWVRSLRNREDPWDPALYDMIEPTDKKSAEACVATILENLEKPALKATAKSRQAAEDFLLATRVEAALAKEGHEVGVQAREGVVTLTINKHVLLLNRLEEELRGIARKIDGVEEAVTKVGEGFYQADIYRRYDFQTPSKVLLVDDEREFVETLSERLIMRDMGSAIAYDGESALDLIEQDEPEVMILDLKMPGIDGIEVLRRVKATRPDIEIIILTGHGSEADRKVCMELGAFAYLQKPVDIDVLSETLKQANDKIQARKSEAGER